MQTFVKLLPLFFCLAVSCARGGYQTEPKAFSDERRLVSDEISNLKISSFAEDSLGHIWIGTFRGLNKYNSYEYTQYFCTDDEEYLPDNQINSLLCDSRGRLWVSTVNGVCLYTDRDNFKRIPVGHLNRNCHQLIEDRTGRILLNNIFQLLLYDEEAGEFVCIVDDLDPRHTFNEKGYVDAENSLWMVNPLYMRRYNAADIGPVDSIALVGHPNASCLQDGRHLWLAGKGTIQLFDLPTRRFLPIPECLSSSAALQASSISLIHPYDGGLLFGTADDGLFFYDQVRDAVFHERESGFPFDAPGFEVTSMFTDSGGNLWMGSVDHGYQVHNNDSRKFNYDRALCSAFEGKSITSLGLDTMNRLWIASNKEGLWVYDTEIQILKSVHLPAGLSVDYVFADSGGFVWLICNDGIVMQCRWTGDALVTDNTYNITWARYMTEDIDGTLWLSCNNWYVYSKKRDESEFVPHEMFDPAMTFIPTLLPMPDGSVLAAGFFKPIARIIASDGSREVLPISEEDYRASIRRSVLIPVDMFLDSSGEVWIGTISNGVLKYSPSDGRLTPVRGVSCSDISAIQEDMLGNVWVSTLHGLFEYERISGHYIAWYAYDGIGGDQFNERTSCLLSNGTLVFGGTHGLTVFDPKNVNERENVSVVFEDLRVFNDLVMPKAGGTIERHLSFRPDVRLNHKQKGFSISFSALYYSEHQRIRYSHMLDGFENYWIDAGNTHEVYYSNLPPGRYTFRVRAADNDKSIISAENTLNIRVMPSPWLSWWAYLLYAVVAGSVCYYIFTLVRRIQREQKAAQTERMEKEQEQRINKMNMSFFSNVSHEFRTPLSMISGPVAQLCENQSIDGNGRKLLRIISRSTDRMLRLVNQMLDFNKLENDALKLKVRMTEMIAELKQNVEIYRAGCEEKNLSLTSYGLEDTFLMLLDTDKLDKIMANLMSNAIKFTPVGGRIEVSFDVIPAREAAERFGFEHGDLLAGDTDEGQCVKISVADTGPGIPEDKLEKVFERYFQIDGSSGGSYNYGSGIGLYYARRLAQLHHGCLKAANKDEGGAVFTLVLPAFDSAYSEAELDSGSEPQNKTYPLYDNMKSAVSAGLNATESEKNPEFKGESTILVVDDDTDVMHYLQTLLSERYRVVCRFDADSAMETMERDVPDVIVCDVMMPGKDGYELCREVKSNLQLCHIPVILLTAKVSTQDKVEGLDSGAEAYVTKPFEPALLLSLINSQLKNRERIRRMLASATMVGQIEEDNLSPQDKTFMDDMYRIMEENVSDSELNVVRIAEQLHISRTKIFYKVKGLTGKTPSSFFKTYKLNRAAELLREGRYSISEIADLTGFSTLSHFSFSFKKQFGVPPSEYGKR